MPDAKALTPNAWDYLAVTLLLAVAGGCLAAWVWLIGRRRRGRSIVPAGWSPLDVPTPGRRPWPTSTLGATILVYMLVQIGVAVGFRDLIAGGSRGQGPPDPSVVLWLTAIINLLTIALVPAVVWATARIGLDDLGLARPADWRRDARPAITLVLLLLPVIYGVMATLSRLIAPRSHPVFESIRGDGGSAGTAWLTFISAVIAAPVAEELLFRGVLLGWLTSLALEGESRRGAWEPGRRAPARALWVPNILASWLFAALHVPQWPAPIPLFLLSLGLGWLAQRTGRLGGPIVAHMAFNGLSTVMLLIATHGAASRAATAPARPPSAAPAPGVLAVPAPAAPRPA
jgi:membrane protease YdiL (CAAX protease family)